MPDMNENAETQQEYLGKVKRIGAEDLQNENTVSYKMGEIAVWKLVRWWCKDFDQKWEEAEQFLNSEVEKWQKEHLGL